MIDNKTIDVLMFWVRILLCGAHLGPGHSRRGFSQEEALTQTRSFVISVPEDPSKCFYLNDLQQSSATQIKEVALIQNLPFLKNSFFEWLENFWFYETLVCMNHLAILESMLRLQFPLVNFMILK